MATIRWVHHAPAIVAGLYGDGAGLRVLLYCMHFCSFRLLQRAPVEQRNLKIGLHTSCLT
jgi:hypothetical protein